MLWVDMNNTSDRMDNHRYVKIKSGKITVLLKIFLNNATCDGFINLSPIFTILKYYGHQNIVHVSHNLGFHGKCFGVIPIVIKLYY